MKILHEVTLDEVRASRPKMIYYGALTCWWATRLPGYRKGSLPSDPRGGVLYQTDKVEGFLKAAEDNPSHYGRHGLRAFLAAFHGVVVTDDGCPTCLRGWDEYSRLLDEKDAAS